LRQGSLGSLIHERRARIIDDSLRLILRQPIATKGRSREASDGVPERLQSFAFNAEGGAALTNSPLARSMSSPRKTVGDLEHFE
jgi:hypothetical protein